MLTRGEGREINPRPLCRTNSAARRTRARALVSGIPHARAILCLAVARDAWDGADMRRRQTCAMDEAGRYLARHSVRSQTFAGGFTPASNSCPLRVR